MQAIRSFDGKTPQLGKHAFVDPAAVVIGDVVLGDYASIWPCACVRGDLEPIVIGAQTNIQDGCVLHTTHSNPYNDGACALTIGANVTVGHNATLHACTIGDLCLLGMNSVVLDGAVIESEVMLAAHSLVTPGTTLASGFLYMGSPAKAKRPLTAAEQDFLRYSANHYVKLQMQHSPQHLPPVLC